ncbi:MAG: hypothetical protein ABJL67_23780 [Sulfitobacter sp.]
MIPDTIPLPIGVVLISIVVLGALLLDILFSQKGPDDTTRFDHLRRGLGLGSLPVTLTFLMGLIWLGLFLLILGGLGWTLVETIQTTNPMIAQEWRFALTKLAALTAVLGAVVALPFSLVRIGLTRIQTQDAQEALFNDKMNAAVADLHAQRQVTTWYTDDQKQQRTQNGWQDDITRRNGAIDALRGLAGERAALLPRIDQMLTVYLREMTREFPPPIAPTGC